MKAPLGLPQEGSPRSKTRRKAAAARLRWPTSAFRAAAGTTNANEWLVVATNPQPSVGFDSVGGPSSRFLIGALLLSGS